MHPQGFAFYSPSPLLIHQSYSRSLHTETTMSSCSKETRKFWHSIYRMQPLLPRFNKYFGLGESSASGQKSETILELNPDPWEAEVLKEEILNIKLNQLNLVSKNLNGMGFNELQQLESEMLEALKSLKILKLNNVADFNKEKILRLKLKQLQLLLKDLSGMGYYELYKIEQELNKGLMSVWAWKNSLKNEMEEPKVKEDHATQQSLSFRGQVQGPQGTSSATEVPPPICFGYNPGGKKENPVKNGAFAAGGNGYYYFCSEKTMHVWRYSLLVLLLCVWFLVVTLAMVLS